MGNSSCAAASERDRYPADEYLPGDRGFRPRRLLFALASDPAPTNIASAESLRPSYAIDSLVRSSLRFSDIVAERSNR